MHKTRIKIILLMLAIIAVTSPINAKNASLGGDFELISHTGKAFKLTDIRGKVGVLFFGFTHCPDVCPNTLLEIQRLMADLKDQADNIQVLFISVDPKRDTPEILNSYVKYFNESIIGLTGTQQQIDQVLEQYKGKVSFSGDTSSNTYNVEHVANLYLIDKSGAIGSIILPRTPYTILQQQVQKLIDG